MIKEGAIKNVGDSVFLDEINVMVIRCARYEENFKVKLEKCNNTIYSFIVPDP